MKTEKFPAQNGRIKSVSNSKNLVALKEKCIFDDVYQVKQVLNKKSGQVTCILQEGASFKDRLV